MIRGPLTLGALTLMTPAMLAGLGLLALPILAHLLNRRITRRLLFPSLALLRPSQAASRSLQRLQRLVLLALRCLALTLVALAFARPLWIDPQAAAAPAKPGEPAGQAVVLVADLSASVRQSSQGLTASQRLRDQASQLLHSLTPGVDRANIILADDQPQPAYPQLSENLAGLAGEAATLKPSEARADLPRALALAGEMLRQSPAHDRRLIVLTDRQASNWQDVTPADVERAMLAGASVSLVSLAPEPGDNAAVLRVAASPASPAVNQPAHIVVTLANFSGRRMRLTGRLAVEGDPVQTHTLLLEAGERRAVAFDHIFRTPGVTRVAFSIDDDALNLDNHADAGVAVRDRQPVLILSDGGQAERFLRRSLAPWGDARDRYDVKTISSADAAALTSEAQVVFITDVATLRPAMAQALQQLLKRGGTVVMFLGDGAVQANVAALAPGVEAGSPVLADPPASLAPAGEWDTPWLDAFGPRSQRSLTQMPVLRYWSLHLSADDAQARTLLHFNDAAKTPAMIATPSSGGHVVLVNLGLDKAWSDLAASGLLVPLAQHLASVAAQTADSEAGPVVGEPLTLFAPLTQADAEREKNAVVVGPDGGVVSSAVIKLGASPTAGDLGVTATVPRTQRAGTYWLLAGGRPLAAATVRIDPRESDLAQQDEDRLKLLFASATARPVRATAADGGQPAIEKPRELWSWCVLAALGVLAIEMGLLSWWKR